ncbi:unnamed protein product [Sphenostylis stenocarpa]|uniref:ENTH domain-containing protein n=1 Tax=Sphenostylis stenocarpa TaxID=92480 RepID=A0AA86TJB5_9FABA|nr:unnamed protein product [Sphenostylis stenocarpa]
MKKALGLSKFLGDFKGLDGAIVKATNYKHALPKEKHVRTIFLSLSPSKPRNEVIYCIHGVTKRFSQTNNWAVAMKTLIVIHRAMRELDSTLWEELVHYRHVRGHMIDLSYFHEKSVPNDYSIWIRSYVLYLEERLKCFALVNYDVATNSSKYSQKLDTQELLEQLPALQNLLSRLLDCKPRGVAANNRLIQFALSLVAGESVKLYVAITIRVVELLDKFFEMYKNDAIRSLQIYKKSVTQPPTSFIITMEEYIKEAPSSLMLEYNMDVKREGIIEHKNAGSAGDFMMIENNADKSTNPSAENNMPTPPQAAELMGLYDLLTGASEFDEKSLATTIIATENNLNSTDDENETNPVLGWEVALFADLESNKENVVTDIEGKEKIGGMELWKHFDEKNGGDTQQSVTHDTSQVTWNPFDFEGSHSDQFSVEVAFPTSQNEFCAFPNMSSPIPAEMVVDMPYQHSLQQQHEPSYSSNKKSINPFDETQPTQKPEHDSSDTLLVSGILSLQGSDQFVSLLFFISPQFESSDERFLSSALSWELSYFLFRHSVPFSVLCPTEAEAAEYGEDCSCQGLLDRRIQSLTQESSSSGKWVFLANCQGCHSDGSICLVYHYDLRSLSGLLGFGNFVFCILKPILGKKKFGTRFQHWVSTDGEAAPSAVTFGSVIF